MSALRSASEDTSPHCGARLWVRSDWRTRTASRSSPRSSRSSTSPPLPDRPSRCTSSTRPRRRSSGSVASCPCPCRLRARSRSSIWAASSSRSTSAGETWPGRSRCSSDGADLPRGSRRRLGHGPGSRRLPDLDPGPDAGAGGVHPRVARQPVGRRARAVLRRGDRAPRPPGDRPLAARRRGPRGARPGHGGELPPCLRADRRACRRRHPCPRVTPAAQYPRRVRVWRSVDEVPADLGRTVVVIGNFDGVHLGHQHVIRQARERADLDGLRVVAVTFDPHPMAVLRPDHAPLMLTDLESRCRLLLAAGADDVLAVPFSREIAEWTPQEFIDRILVDSLHARHVVVGANFRFGNRAAGDVTTLVRAGESGDFEVEGVPLDGGPQVWSSTYVRTCLTAGDVEGAAEALGRPYGGGGEVGEGGRRGRELGYPTANVPTSSLLAAPADGVYAGWLRRLDPSTGSGQGSEATPLPAAISVGTNPTFDGERERRVEAYVLDRDDLELYGVEVEVSFVARIRGMLRFESVEELIDTMRGDVERARELLAT